MDTVVLLPIPCILSGAVAVTVMTRMPRMFGFGICCMHHHLSHSTTYAISSAAIAEQGFLHHCSSPPLCVYAMTRSALVWACARYLDVCVAICASAPVLVCMARCMLKCFCVSVCTFLRLSRCHAPLTCCRVRPCGNGAICWVF